MTNNKKVPELSKREFESFISKGNTIVDFFAEWCMPCLMMSPIIEDLNEKFRGKIKFGKVNIDENQELARKFNISSIPNLIIFNDGKPINQIIGMASSKEIKEKIKKFLK